MGYSATTYGPVWFFFLILATSYVDCQKLRFLVSFYENHLSEKTSKINVNI